MKKLDKHIFQQLELVYKKYEFLKSKEEKFNIFSVLYKDYEEVKLHSRFISTLLNPYASHKKGSIFLKEFINIFSDDILKFDNFDKAVVYPEEWNKKEYHHIDILIIDRKQQNAIIIENKLNAYDSSKGKQLERYFKFVRDEEEIPQENITTFYLTLDGHEPSDDSLGEFKELSNINGYCITYNYHVIKWLNRCLMYVSDKPFIRESIFQYKNLIKKITMDNKDIEERLEIRETIAKDEISMNSTKYIIDNFKHIKWHTVRDFWDELSCKLVSLDFEVVEEPTHEQITDITHYEIYRKGQKDKQYCGIKFKVNENLELFIWNEADDWIYWGASITNVKNSSLHVIFNDFFSLQEKYKYWWKNSLEDDNRIWLSNFSHQATFNLINKDKRAKVVENIIKEIKNFLIVKLHLKF